MPHVKIGEHIVEVHFVTPFSNCRFDVSVRVTGKAPIELFTLWTELMLAAFGIECLIKATWVKQGHQLARNGKYVPMLQNEAHQLVPLCCVAGIMLDAREADVLERISIIARTIGRYPIPRRAHETRPREFYRQTGSPLNWSSDDDQVVENFVVRLKTSLRRRSGKSTSMA
jgi:hypothetical protein